jgi:RNA-directed DNA polymerase
VFGSQGYRWALDADIEACFDSIDHTALMDRVRQRVKDKRVLALVKSFLKAGIMTELGERDDTTSGTPQGGILSPLLANIALSVLDDFAAEQWAQTMATRWQREKRRARGLGTWRLVRYADDFVVLVHGTQQHAEQLRAEVSEVLAPMGLRLSPSKTRVVHLVDGFDFLGFRIKWMCKRGTDKWHVYTFIADKPVQALKRKIRALTQKLSHLDYKVALVKINQIQRGWANYFRHAVAKHTFARLKTFVWWRVIRWVMHRNRKSWEGHPAMAPYPTGMETHRFRRSRVVRSRGGFGHPVSLPRKRDPLTLAGKPWNGLTQRRDLVESPVLSNGHAGFGGRAWETDPE